MRKISALVLALLAVVLVGCGGGSHPAANHGYKTKYGISPHKPGFATLPPPGNRFKAAAPQPTLEMFDTITLSTVPANPRAVAGYTSGYWPTYLPLVRAYPKALHLSIAVTAGHAADCLDDEPGDATPGQVVGWVRWQLSLHHIKPCVYASVSQMFSSINPLLAQAGLSGAVRRWCAWYRYKPGLISGCDAIQWTDRAFNSNLDESTVAASFFNLAPPPPPRVHCFGPHAQVKLAKCVVIRKAVHDRTGEIKHITNVSYLRFQCEPSGAHSVNRNKEFCLRLARIVAADKAFISANLF